MLEIIIQQSTVPVVVDAGIGVPSHATQALEMGADAVLVNTAIAVADESGDDGNRFPPGCRSGSTGASGGAG
ncbi:thiazole synthase [Salmonella enterica subsp. enterica]|uniref:thiazole synthase n=1 Tax=Salmonella enterica I TaxID=59201 RepID=A0A379X4L4_SALET|nr:thiazole synthase [Salmonella enterica subsp. enterica]